MRAPRLILLLLVGPLAGCSTPRSTTFEVPAGRYARAFDTAREVLIEHRFAIDRVDARLGQITTWAKTTSGLASPWDGEQSSLVQEIEDAVNQQRRRVRVTFTPGQGGEAASPDLLAHTGAVTGRVHVALERLQRPGWRVPSRAVRQTSVATDPLLTRRGVPPVYAVVKGEDDRLAARLAQEIARRLETPASDDR